MPWTVEFHKKAREEIDELPKSLRSKLRFLLNDMEAGGFGCLSPKSVKNIGDGIRELRVKSNDGIARSLYATRNGKKIDILLAFVKKTTDTPHRYIKLAQKRREEIQNERNDTMERN